MKTLILALVMLFPYSITAQDTLTVEQPSQVETVADSPTDEFNLLDFLGENVLAILLALIAFLEVIVRLTPTEKDNNILRVVQSWLDKLIPNQKKGGGAFVAYSDSDSTPFLGAK